MTPTWVAKDEDQYYIVKKNVAIRCNLSQLPDQSAAHIGKLPWTQAVHGALKRETGSGKLSIADQYL